MTFKNNFKSESNQGFLNRENSWLLGELIDLKFSLFDNARVQFG
ncbi:hypothetical protein JCM19231_2178 [Vibrio ishigakensis]|uniref:Uncharacterized protein n=1 Tax=Vibrio ishigakensis TaxID=1481914 RepID=A0A0B8P503_9VIBR|nr:hypothetical protein JCM19231_2178 [Vibrio ishigakensis]